jgi:hypothetical protein
MSVEHHADMLEVELMEAAVPRGFHCEALKAMEGWLRYMSGRGNILHRIGFLVALEAVKVARHRRCPDEETSEQGPSAERAEGEDRTRPGVP